MHDTTVLARTLILEALRSMVNDHGDAFRWSVSKRGRIWLTLTHWDSEKYNTSVELGGMSDVDDMISALAVLVVAHKAKCFGTQAHTDTWLGYEQTSHLASDATDALRPTSANGSDDAPGTTSASTDTKVERDKAK